MFLGNHLIAETKIVETVDKSVADERLWNLAAGSFAASRDAVRTVMTTVVDKESLVKSISSMSKSLLSTDEENCGEEERAQVLFVDLIGAVLCDDDDLLDRPLKDWIECSSAVSSIALCVQCPFRILQTCAGC
jgi:hypothetical protein